MKANWLPLKYVYFIDAITPKACKTKFSNALYDIPLTALK